MTENRTASPGNAESVAERIEDWRTLCEVAHIDGLSAWRLDQMLDEGLAARPARQRDEDCMDSHETTDRSLRNVRQQR